MLDAEKIERDSHNRFKDASRFQPGEMGHEWFAATPELMESIGKEAMPLDQAIQTIQAQPDAIPITKAELLAKLFVVD